MTKNKSRRSTFEIYLDILRYMKEFGPQCKPTRIMYGANLSWKGMKDYMTNLLNGGLIKIDDPVLKNPGYGTSSKKDKRSKVTYTITTKGEDVLRITVGPDQVIEGLEEMLVSHIDP